MKSLVSIQSPKTIQLTNPRIIAFYEKYPNISFETINLLIIDLFESTAINNTIPEIITDVNNQFQINELKTAFENIKNTVSQQMETFASEFLIAKTKYVNEFRSIWIQSDCVSKRTFLLENNDTIVNTMEHITYEIRNIKGIHHLIGEKIGAIVKQFHKIIHTNIESILSKTTDMSILSKEFIQNFEMNAAHMIQTIQQLLCDFVSTKETHTKSALETLSTNGEGANAVYSKLLYELNDFLHHIRGKPVSETTPNLETILSRLYNTASIRADTPSNLVLSRVGKTEVFIQQSIIKDRNINVDEIKTFLQYAHEGNHHGILISQHTGITSKPNLYIEILHNRVFLYVHNLDYSPEKLQTAIEILDTISAKLSEFNVSSDEKYAIPKEVLDEMNREYQSFIGQKETFLNTLKDTYKKLLTQIEDIRFVSLDKYLSTRYSSCKKQGYVCSLCNSFTVSTLKGLAAHKRGCNRKISGVQKVPDTANTGAVSVPKYKTPENASTIENRFEVEL